MPVPGHILSGTKCAPVSPPPVFLYRIFLPLFLGQRFVFAHGALCKQRWPCHVVDVVDAPLLRFIGGRWIGERVVGDKAPLDAGVTEETLTTGGDGTHAILGLTQCANLHLMFWEHLALCVHYMFPSPLSHKRTMLAILAVFKNEADVLDEWIQHYLLEGVSKFYLIDNGSTDEPARVLDPYTPRLVEWWPDTSPHAQVRLYNEALERIRAERHPPEWLLVCDLDEFLYASWGTVEQYLSRLPPDVGAVSVRWLMFGSSGRQQQPPEGVVAGFLWRAQCPREKDDECKTIVRLRAVKELRVHEHVLRSPNQWRWIKYTAHNEVEIASSLLRLNHYCIMSWERFRDVKMTRGNRGIFKMKNMSRWGCGGSGMGQRSHAAIFSGP